jgi:hypothetical protein
LVTGGEVIKALCDTPGSGLGTARAQFLRNAVDQCPRIALGRIELAQ